MGWIIYFWAIAAWLILAWPFKIADYISGKDKSSRSGRIEEVANGCFFLVGLVGLYGYVYRVTILTPSFWRAWIVVAIALSIFGIFRAPKLKYATEVMGKRLTRLVLVVGFAVFIPMFVGLFDYSSRS